MGFELHCDDEKLVAKVEVRAVPIRTARQIEADEDKKLLEQRDRAIRQENKHYQDVEIF